MQCRTASIAALLLVGQANAADPQRRIAEPEIVELDRIQVTATRTPHAAQDVPASISVVEGEDYRTDTLGASLSEKLATVPGLLARNRNNYAQAEQLSIRGFGTRASFGIRGVRLYVDGIPATMPDGQGQVSHFPLASAERIEVLRGPFSVLYGTASGGVIQLFTADGTAPTSIGIAAVGGSSDSRRLSVDLRGANEVFDYSVGLNHPYPGQELIRRHGRPAHGQHGLQIEIRRSLYMDEARCEKHAGFGSLVADLGRFVQRLSAALAGKLGASLARRPSPSTPEE